MRRGTAASIVRAMFARPSNPNVHFHADSDGRPFVCDVDRCESPSLSPSEVWRGRN